MTTKITPNLWITAPANEVKQYYQEIFGPETTVTTDFDFDDTPGGEAHIFTMVLKGMPFRIMCTGKHDDFTDAVSFEITCEDQAEINHFWNSFTKEGEESQCGWCRDKYGVRWQIVPKNMSELMQKPNAMQTMLSQKKIIIADY